jgi:hypothetical protein
LGVLNISWTLNQSFERTTNNIHWYKFCMQLPLFIIFAVYNTFYDCILLFCKFYDSVCGLCAGPSRKVSNFPNQKTWCNFPLPAPWRSSIGPSSVRFSVSLAFWTLGTSTKEGHWTSSAPPTANASWHRHCRRLWLKSARNRHVGLVTGSGRREIRFSIEVIRSENLFVALNWSFAAIVAVRGNS